MVAGRDAGRGGEDRSHQRGEEHGADDHGGRVGQEAVGRHDRGEEQQRAVPHEAPRITVEVEIVDSTVDVLGIGTERLEEAFLDVLGQ